jgi:type II secretory pathway pseudopilin PulG
MNEMINLTTSRRIRSPAGLSLLELLVVLTILIALGGIVVSTLPNMLRRTQVATAAANIPAIEASIRRTALLKQGEIGNRFDSLVTGTGGLDGEVASYIGGAENFEATILTPSELEALHQIGVTELVPADRQAENATFGSHDQAPVALGAGSKVCRISPGFAPVLQREGWNLEPVEGASYLVFGLGEQSSLVGAGPQAVFSEAPIHFSDDRLRSPETMYTRYMLIVEVQSKSDSNSVARFIGAAIPGKDGLHHISRELENHYSNQ